MTPRSAIASLDRAIARTGQTVVLDSNDRSATQTIAAVVRGYRPEELTGDITQEDRKVILSPTGLTFVPSKTDFALVQDVTCSIEAVNTIVIQDAVVRIEMQIRG